MAYMRLGDLLIAAGAITEEQLQTALQTQKQSGQRLGDVLIDSGSSSMLCRCSWAWTIST